MAPLRCLVPRTSLFLLAIVLIGAPASLEAAAFLPVGVLGNSGQAGPGVVKVGAYTLDRCATGLYCDRDFTLYASGGEALNRYSLDGWLIERIPLVPAGSRVDSHYFARLGDTLYFLGHRPDGKWALFVYPLTGAQEATALDVALPTPRMHWFTMAAEPLQGRLVLFVSAQDSPANTSTVYFLDPAEPRLEKAFDVPALYPAGVAVDPVAQLIYLGAMMNLSPDPSAPLVNPAVTIVRPDGGVVGPEFPTATVKTPAIPTAFRGRLSLADGALWDTAWYGFLARLDRQTQGAPGMVIHWHHDLGYPTQILGLADRDPAGLGKGLVAITTAAPDAIYLARWRSVEQRLELMRRIGSLRAHSVGLSPDGWVTASSDRCQYWWRWEDGPAQVPRKAELHLALTPGFFLRSNLYPQGAFFALAAQYNITGQKYTPTIFKPDVVGNNEAFRSAGDVPMKQPHGLAVDRVEGKDQARLLVTDGESRAIWENVAWLPQPAPDPARWTQVGLAPGVELQNPGDIVALEAGRLLLADAGAVLLLEPGPQGYTVGWRLQSWGEQPEERFGPRLRLAVSGDRLLVSDTDRHRLLWFELRTRRFLAQLGSADHAGSDWYHLDSPGPVGVEGSRALLADLGNERLLKLELLREAD